MNIIQIEDKIKTYIFLRHLKNSVRQEKRQREFTNGWQYRIWTPLYNLFFNVHTW